MAQCVREKQLTLEYHYEIHNSRTQVPRYGISMDLKLKLYRIVRDIRVRSMRILIKSLSHVDTGVSLKKLTCFTHLQHKKITRIATLKCTLQHSRISTLEHQRSNTGT